MLGLYSFKKHFLEALMSNGTQMFPGAEKLLAVYYDNQNLGVVGKERLLENEADTHNATLFTDDTILKLRKQRSRSTWLKNFDFDSSKISVKAQLNIQSELDNHVLLVRFPNAADGFSDMLFIYFKNEDQIFKFSDNPQKLSTSIKEIVANMLVRSLDVFRKQILNDTAIFNLINKADAQHNQEIELLKEQLKKKESEQVSYFKGLANAISEPFGDRIGLQFEWSESSINKLINLQIPAKALKTLIESALIIASNRSITLHKKLTILPTDLIVLDLQKQIKDSPVISIRYERTFMLLDRYEEAAQKVVQNNLRLTGATLGNNCNPSVSPAAISDALKKHGKKIITLFDKYPNRWSLLRQEFRPVKNMVYKSGLSQYKAS